MSNENRYDDSSRANIGVDVKFFGKDDTPRPAIPGYRHGYPCPTRIKWIDGREYEIDRIRDIRPASSLKAGVAGLRYEIEVSNDHTTKRTYIWLVDLGTYALEWVAEKKEN